MARSQLDEGARCQRCGEIAFIKGRAELLCESCFINYVKTKVVKRMEKFRVKNAELGKPRTLLLPLSLGVSSVALLYVLDIHIQSQLNRTGRTGFDLHVLHILPPDQASTDLSAFDAVKQRFPRHTYSSISLSTAFSLQDDSSLANGNHLNSHSESNGNIHGTEPSYSRLLSSLASVTSRTDVLRILRTRIIVEFALQNSCEGIFWGDSTTKLAEKVLAETAKGRGFSLPWQIADGTSPYGIFFYYPMRDLLKKELTTFAAMVQPPLTPLLHEDGPSEPAVPAASKNGSIDVLMKQYFESVENQYPSIVANVVRTTGKLEARISANARFCRLCKMPFSVEELANFGGLGASGEIKSTSSSDGIPCLCYGCSRAVPPEAAKLIPAD